MIRLPHISPRTPEPAAASPLLTVAEAAGLLRVTPKTVRRMVERGELRPVRLGRAVRFKRADLNAFIDAGGTPPVPKAAA